MFSTCNQGEVVMYPYTLYRSNLENLCKNITCGTAHQNPSQFHFKRNPSILTRLWYFNLSTLFANEFETHTFLTFKWTLFGGKTLQWILDLVFTIKPYINVKHVNIIKPLTPYLFLNSCCSCSSLASSKSSFLLVIIAQLKLNGNSIPGELLSEYGNTRAEYSHISKLRWKWK